MLLMAIMIAVIGLAATISGCLMIREDSLWLRIWGTLIVVIGSCVGAIGVSTLLVELMWH